MESVAHKKKYRNLQALPPEILLKIKQEITDFGSHLAFSRLCSSSREIYTEDTFRHVCLDAGFAKPLIWHHRSWSEIAGAIYYHASACQKCKDCLSRLPEEQERFRQIYNATSQTPHVRIIPELRASIGAYDVDWKAEDQTCAAAIAIRSSSLPRSDVKGQCLHKHITLAARLITTVPIQNITLAFEGDQSWGFDGFAGLDATRTAWHASFSTNQRTVYSAEELYDICFASLGYRTTAYNREGLTCHDLLSAAAKVPGMPCGLEDGKPLVFASILDDQIRQGLVWVQARTV